MLKRVATALVALGFLTVSIGAASGSVLGFRLTVAPSDTGTFTCTVGSFFQDNNGQLSKATSLLTWHKIGTAHSFVNAVAYSPFTKLIYALDAKIGPDLNKLVSIKKTGVQTVLGKVTGLPKGSYKGGDIDPTTGTYYVTGGGSSLYAINISTKTATAVTLPQGITMGYDLVVQDQWIWTVSALNLSGFSLVTGASKVISLTIPNTTDAAGSMWGDAVNHAIYFRWTKSGKVFKVSGVRTTAFTVTSLGTSATKGAANDGATCSAIQSAGPDTAPVLTLTGTLASPLYPGMREKLDLHFQNGYATAVTVWSGVIKVTLSGGTIACPLAANYNVRKGLTADVTVPGNTSTSLSGLGIPQSAWPVIEMIDTSHNQSACEGLPLTIHLFWRYHG